MIEITTIGLDLAKSVFQVHGVDASGKVVVRRQLKRGDVMGYFDKLLACLVGMEACGTAHHWGRALRKLGHTVRLMPPNYVKSYVKRGKNDAADAEAICEAVSRPSMREVAVKTVAQQSVLMLHRARDLLMRQRTQSINALRGHMAEIGIIAAEGHEGAKALAAIVADGDDARVPCVARLALRALVANLAGLEAQIAGLDAAIGAATQRPDT